MVFGESVARLWGPEGKYNKPQRIGSNIPIRERSEKFHHNLKPNTKAVMYRGEEELPPIVFEINSLGIRGPEIREKPFDGGRILILGDSFIEDRLNRFEETIGQVLEKKIADKNIDVIQHGVSSWSPLTELNWYLKVGRTIKPDIVILFLILNDFYCAESYSHSDAAYQKECILDESGYPIRFTFKKAPAENMLPEKPKSSVERLADKSRFLKWITLKIEHVKKRILFVKYSNMLMRISAAEFEQISPKVLKNIEDSKIKKDIIGLTRPEELWGEKTKIVVDKALANVKKLQNSIQRDGGKLITTLIPLRYHFKSRNIREKLYKLLNCHFEVQMGGIEQRVKSFCRKNKILYMDLYSALKYYKENNNDELYFIHDRHWNAIGNKVVADILYENLFEKLRADSKINSHF